MSIIERAVLFVIVLWMMAVAGIMLEPSLNDGTDRGLGVALPRAPETRLP
jgi:hypothetical protein